MARKAKSKAKAKAKAKTKKAPARVKAKNKRTAAPRVKAKAKTAPRSKAAAKKTKRAGRPAAKPRRREVPEGYSSVTAYLIAHDAADAIDYYKDVFGAEEVMRMLAPGGKVGHAELIIGDSKIMLADESPEMNARGPKTVGGTPVTIMVYVEDVDDVVERAIERGAKLLREVKDQFYGDRSGAIEDPQGHVWHISTHFEDVSPKEMKRRMDAMMAPEAKQPLSHSSAAHPGPESPEEAEASS
ncbi:MAG TPA: VOC family protein [Candidatus Cybelea sp.]|nr:VOC family protein [Candidatus Cybelea sp.]